MAFGATLSKLRIVRQADQAADIGRRRALPPEFAQGGGLVTSTVLSGAIEHQAVVPVGRLRQTEQCCSSRCTLVDQNRSARAPPR